MTAPPRVSDLGGCPSRRARSPDTLTPPNRVRNRNHRLRRPRPPSFPRQRSMRPQPRGTEEDGEGGGSGTSTAARLGGATQAETRPGRPGAPGPRRLPGQTHWAAGKGPPSGRGVVRGRGGGCATGRRGLRFRVLTPSPRDPPGREQYGMKLVLLVHLSGGVRKPPRRVCGRDSNQERVHRAQGSDQYKCGKSLENHKT